MPSAIGIGTKNVPLDLAKAIAAHVNDAWASGELESGVSPVTRDLLSFWFREPHTETRPFNFHEGQRQAILNAIFLHEMVRVKTVEETYLHFDVEQQWMPNIDMAELKKEKYALPKYAIKMATGTGKTWVMHALVVWQYLNAKYETEPSGRFTKNFLMVAPGIIVYERLLDAYLGKENRKQEREFETSDIFRFRDLFVPAQYREEVFGFVQNGVAKKQEIGTKTTGDGLIAIANWHLFMDREKEEDFLADDPSSVVKAMLPIRPGVSGGNALDALDARYAGGREIDFLSELPDLMIVNDEAQWMGDTKKYGEIMEKQWQRSVNAILENKRDRCAQFDFSATPYIVTGSGQKRTKHYFPHIIVDFDLKTAIRGGLVKTIAIDKRKELTEIALDFSAIREGGAVIGLSDGQKLMLRAGLKKLDILEEHFTAFSKDANGVSDKYPKMLVMCEDTAVSPLVEAFLLEEGYTPEDVVRVDSNKKGEIAEDEWRELKQKLFNIDRYARPKIIVSVLMLREGFDVNNICVIVPLRSATAPILLEQTIGRGLRLMWREPEFVDVKEENRRRLLKEKKEPSNYLDLLTIIEHPAFVQFYDDLLKEGLAGEVENDPEKKENVLGDIINVGLKENWREYDFFWPIIIRDSEEVLETKETDVQTLEPFSAYSLEQLRRFFQKEGESFVSEDILVKTRFGEYAVDASLFSSRSYNEYLEKILHSIVQRMARVTPRKTKEFPVMQIHHLEVVGVIDRYIRERLFGRSFDPFEGNNWKVLLLKNGIVTRHIVKEMSAVVIAMQNVVSVRGAKVERRYFSEVREMRIREKYSLEIAKSIYERVPYPSNKGGFEKAFLEYADGDAGVCAVMKVSEYFHSFASILYVRTDGFLSVYHPDFSVRTQEKIYIVETKSDKDLGDLNVRQKRLATLDFLKRVNALDPEDRMRREWEYVLLGETDFYTLSGNNASVDELCALSKVTREKVEGKLF